MRPADKARLERAWQRFQDLKRQLLKADQTGRFSDACSLEAEERRAHIALGFLMHEADGE
jgi:hypothetical protein